MFSLICAWTNGWVSNRHAGDLKRHRTHYYVTVMSVMQTVRSGAARQRWLWLQRTFVPILTRFYNGNSYIDDTLNLFSTSMQVWTKPFTEDISKCMFVKEVFTFRSYFINQKWFRQWLGTEQASRTDSFMHICIIWHQYRKLNQVSGDCWNIKTRSYQHRNSHH